jgi:glycosyltransferase involved in cell wall biosynthesis
LGTPVISHAVGGIPDVLNHGSCGILIFENAPCNYANAINQVVNNPEKTLKMTQLATQRINERYTAKTNAQAYYLQYKSLLR